jgi:AraC-like DNA-binding protein
MVSNRCKTAVKEVFQKYGLFLKRIELGEVEVTDFIQEDIYVQLKISLLELGFQLMEDKRIVLIERIKNIIIEMVHYSDEHIKKNFSDYLSEKLNYDYTYLANRFSEMQGISIEHFIISHKIERVKELIIDDELNITEIAYKMNYSSLAHLSTQFKKVTGLTPIQFKKLKLRKRDSIENVGTHK